MENWYINQWCSDADKSSGKINKPGSLNVKRESKLKL